MSDKKSLSTFGGKIPCSAIKRTSRPLAALITPTNTRTTTLIIIIIMATTSPLTPPTIFTTTIRSTTKITGARVPVPVYLQAVQIPTTCETLTSQLGLRLIATIICPKHQHIDAILKSP